MVLPSSCPEFPQIVKIIATFSISLRNHTMNDVAFEETRVPIVVTSAVIMLILSGVAVILRVWSRMISRRQCFWWDDWFAIATFVSIK